MSNSTKDYREMDAKTLSGQVGRLERELLEVGESVRMGKEKNHAQIKITKRELARAKTILNEKIDH